MIERSDIRRLGERLAAMQADAAKPTHDGGIFDPDHFLGRRYTWRGCDFAIVGYNPGPHTIRVHHDTGAIVTMPFEWFEDVINSGARESDRTRPLMVRP